jgi:glycosyltransferase involved in cell wall biosynthesis
MEFPQQPVPPTPVAGLSVLFVSNDPSIFDAVSPARARMRRYAERLGTLHILSRGKGEYVQDGPLHLHPVGGMKLLALRKFPELARAIILKHGIQVVSAQDPFELGTAALAAVSGTGAKLHLQVHTDFLSPWFVQGVRFPMSWRNRMRLRAARENIPGAHGIRTVSARVARRVREVFPQAVAPSVIAIAVDPALPAPVPLGLEECRFMFIAVGRLEAEKRVDDLLKALAMVVTKYPHTCLTLVGDGRERRRLEKLARKRGISSNVRFLGTRPDARALMQSAHAFVQASAYEGYGLSLIEAALAGIPIVTTDVGIVGDVLRPIHDALVVPVGEPFELALAMIELIENNERRMKVARSAEAQVRAHLAANPDPVGAIVADLAACIGAAR